MQILKICWEQAKLDGSKKPEKRRKIVAPKSDNEMSVQVICAPQKISKKKTTINTLDVSAEEMDYQKKLKWLKDHGELTGEEGNTQGEDSSGNDSAWHTPVGIINSNRNCYEYFNSMATLLRPSKKSKVDQLSSITKAYIATIKGSKDPIIWKSMRILLDSGCAATLINQNFVKTLKTTKEYRTKWTTKAGNFSTHR
jgi:hypothetical protein